MMKTIVEFHNLILSVRIARRIGTAVGFVAAMAVPVVVRAQGCAMCYNTASAAKKSGLQALQSGIWILLIPPVIIFAAILWYAYRRRDNQDAFELDPATEP